MEIHDIQPLDGFNWEEFERNTNSQVSPISKGYDEEPVFHQGIAIVKRNGKYGAIMVGGKEIVPPIYDALTEFTDGLAKVEFKGKERIVNLSGQVQVKKDNKDIFLPEDYDWGYDYVNKICVVIKSGKYGIIDDNFKIIHGCDYTTFIDFQNGYAVLGNNKTTIIINNEAKECYKVIESFPDGNRIISTEANNRVFKGVMKTNMEIVIPISYLDIHRLKSGYYIVTTVDNTELLLDNNDGTILSKIDSGKIKDINETFFVIHKTSQNDESNETYICKAPATLIISIPYNVDVTLSKDDVVKFSLNGLSYECDSEGNLSIVGRKIKYGSSQWDFRWENIAPRKVNHTYLEFAHSSLTKDYEVIEDNKNLKGVSNIVGDTIIKPQYNFIRHLYGDLFIVALPNINDGGKTLAFGVVDKSNNIKIPFEYKCLIPINNKFVAYAEGHLYDVTDNNEYWIMDFRRYVNISFGILDIAGNKVSDPIFSIISGIKTGLGFIVGVEIKKANQQYSDLKYGIIDSKGDYIVMPKYEQISYDESYNLFKTTLSYSETGRYPFEKLSNNVSIDGFFVIHDDNGIISKVPVKLADWCGSFSEDGYAEVIKGGIKGKINKTNQIVSFINEKCVVIPKQYDFACNFNFGYAPVSQKGKYGIIDAMLKEIIPCNYEYIEPLSPTRFKYREGNKWGIIDNQLNIIHNSEFDDIFHETEKHFKVQVSIQNGSCRFPRYGLIDENGNIVVPARFDEINTITDDANVFWILNNHGVYKEGGGLIIPVLFDSIELQDSKFTCKIFEQTDRRYSYSNRDKRVKSVYYYTLKGEQYINIDEKYTHIVPSEYDIAFYAGLGLIRVKKDDKWGLINLMNDVVISPMFAYIDVFNGLFAEVGRSEDGKSMSFPEKHICGLKYGLIDTSGEIVLPLEYNYMYKWDNGYYCVKKDNLYILLSPSLNPVFETERRMEKLDDRYILIEGDSTYATKYGLIDFNGNEIIPTDEEHCFSEIEVLKNGFLKVTYHKREYGSPHIGILNMQGKTVFEKPYYCDDITLLDYGFCLVKCDNYGSPSTYSLVNLQGKEILPNSYYEIKLVNDGIISLRNYGGWGLADIKGNIIIETDYLDELVFENGVANIKVKGSSLIQKINKNGIVIVHNGKNEIELPHSVYWGTDFINKISIVRGKGRGYDVIGAADIKGNIIIPTRYKSVVLLSNKTIRVQDGDCYGIFDLKGNNIFPPIFTSIEYISEERMKVTWNLKFATKWSRNDYIPGSDSKYKGGDNDYLANNRSAICNSKAEIINDKEIILVGKFINGYARAYKEVTIEKGRVQLKQAGVVDTSGKTIIPLIYDGIIIYEDSPYIRLRKKGKYGIANLKSGKQKMFNELDIKHLWDVDKLGRCIYSEDCEYDSDCEDWIGGTRGVLGIKGIIVPAGKYHNIYLLDNGLIEVTNETGDLYGLLDKDGKEVLPIQYSYISSFKGNLASICINGKRDDEWPYKIKGGKWGVIDSIGKFVKECVSDSEEVLEEKESDYKRTDDNVQFKKPSVVLSDRIPEPKERNSYDYGYDSYYDNDNDGPYSKYGGYNGWDDNTIDEAFDGNPELTWNID